ncbi:CABIT domain [Trinorchestia longiramus]|nr:CABIT domain [Trinorchestia longiramus]
MRVARPCDCSVATYPVPPSLTTGHQASPHARCPQPSPFNNPFPQHPSFNPFPQLHKNLRSSTSSPQLLAVRHSSSSPQMRRNSSSSRNLPPSSASCTPRSLLEQQTLPAAAYLHTPTPPPPGLDPRTPLLLYKTSYNTKVRAVSLKTNSSGAIIAAGPTLVIPDCYTGWFSVVSGRCKGATCLTSMDEVAEKNLTFFLTRHEIPSYVRMSDNSRSGNPRYRRSVVAAGHVLKLLGLFEDTKREGHNRTQGTGDRFAQCLDHRGQVVFVPLSARGKFYATADRNPALQSLDQVYLMSQLIEGFQLPLTVRLVCGYMAKVPNCFTGLLKLESAQQEQVLLACTMTPDTNATFVEMDLDSNFILTPIKDPVFPKTPLYLKTKSYCEDEAEAWQRQIKITHHVTDTRPVYPARSSPSATLSDTASSTGLVSPAEQDGGRRLRHVRGVRELKAQDRSRESRKSDDQNAERISRDKSRTRDKSRDERIRDKSKDSKLRLRIREKSRDRLTIRNGSDATSFDILREKSNVQESVLEKFSKVNKSEGKEPRKVSKQNTYIFQNVRNTKFQEKKKESEDIPPPVPEHSLSYRLRQSVDNQDYSTVLDDVSRLQRPKIIEEDEDECQYAEICDNIYSTTVISSSSDQDSSTSSYNHRVNRTGRGDRLSSSHNWSFGTGGTSSSDDNHYSFTLLRQDVGQSYTRLAGFSAGDIVPRRHFTASAKHAYRPRSPAASQC